MGESEQQVAGSFVKGKGSDAFHGRRSRTSVGVHVGMAARSPLPTYTLMLFSFSFGEDTGIATV